MFGAGRALDLRVEVHHGLGRLGERRPRRQAGSIGIAGLREVHPSSCSSRSDIARSSGRGGSRPNADRPGELPERPEHVRDLCGVTGAVRRLRRPMIEVVDVRLARAVLRLQQRPRPRVPCEHRRRARCCACSATLPRPWRADTPQESFGVLAVAGANRRFESAGGVVPGMKRDSPFVRVRADEHGRVVEALRLIELVLVAWQHVTVEYRPESALKARPKRGLNFFSGNARAAVISLAPSLARKPVRSASATLSGGTFCPPSFGERAAGRKCRRFPRSRGGTSPFAAGEAASMLTDMPPADSPKIVTRVRIATKLRDVVLHPPQARDLILQPVVAGPLAALLDSSSGCARKPNTPNAVADADEHDAFLRQRACRRRPECSSCRW